MSCLRSLIFCCVAIFLAAMLIVQPFHGWADDPVGEEGPSKYNYSEKLNHRGIWDGNLTRAKSGLGWEIPDPGSSEGKAGPDTVDRIFLVPKIEDLNIRYDEMERDDLSGIDNVRDYANEALIQFPYDMMVDTYHVPKGYYLVQLGDQYSGSERVNLGHYDEAIPPAVLKNRKKRWSREFSAIILKKQGRVVAVMPISRRVPYDRQKGQRKAKKYAFARMDESAGDPVLKVYYKNWIYCADIAPALRPVVNPAVTRGADYGLPPLSP